MTRAHALGACVGAALALAAAGGYALTRHSEVAGARAQPRTPAPLLSRTAFERRSGVRIVRVAVTGGGGLLDLRYQVLDPAAAVSIHDKATPPPDLVDERTGVVADQLLMGHSHAGRFKAAQTYYLIFDNPGALVRRGGRVTVQLGPARLAHVPVR